MAEDPKSNSKSWLVDYLDMREEDINISDSLIQLADENGLPSSDVIMLSKINFRGKVPKNIDQWRMIYSIIKSVLEDN